MNRLMLVFALLMILASCEKSCGQQFDEALGFKPQAGDQSDLPKPLSDDDDLDSSSDDDEPLSPPELPSTNEELPPLPHLPFADPALSWPATPFQVSYPDPPNDGHDCSHLSEKATVSADIRTVVVADEGLETILIRILLDPLDMNQTYSFYFSSILQDDSHIGYSGTVSPAGAAMQTDKGSMNAPETGPLAASEKVQYWPAGGAIQMTILRPSIGLFDFYWNLAETKPDNSRACDNLSITFP